MTQEIKALYEVIRDYRSGEVTEISELNITHWINQFVEEDRVFILNELKHIFDKVYFSKIKAKNFLKSVINRLKKDLGYSTHKELLDNSNFLDLQAVGKSQKKLLELLFEVLKDDFNYNSKDLGSNSEKHNVYIDDVLCTGNTFFNNLKGWISEKDSNRLSDLRSKKIDLNVFYIFIAEKYFRKKKGQFYHHFGQDFDSLIKVLAARRFEKELLKPIEDNITEIIIEYKEKIESNANTHAENKDFPAYHPDFYRNTIDPEEFYSSIENRMRLELIFLQKGVEILNNSNVSKTNVRPLGYSLPSYKDFGFGALIFTWRNIANNTPLVFWYRGGGFVPLFVNKR